jgi:hypothetical protein
VVRVRGQVFGREILNRCHRSEMGRDGLIELASFVKVDRALKLLVGEVLQGLSAHELSIQLKDFGGQSRANIRGRAEITAEDQFVIWIKQDIIPVHYPIIPTKFSNVADVSGRTGHDGLRHLAGGHINVIACARMHKSFELKAVVPQGFRGTRADHFVQGSLFNLVDAAFSSLLPRGIGFGHSKVAISLPEFLSEVTQGLLFQELPWPGEPHHDGTRGTKSHEPHPCISLDWHGPIQRMWSKSVPSCYPDGKRSRQT